MRAAAWLPRFHRAYASMGEMEAKERWTRDQIESFQLA